MIRKFWNTQTGWHNSVSQFFEPITPETPLEGLELFKVLLSILHCTYTVKTYFQRICIRFLEDIVQLFSQKSVFRKRSTYLKAKFQISLKPGQKMLLCWAQTIQSKCSGSPSFYVIFHRTHNEVTADHQRWQQGLNCGASKATGSSPAGLP